MRKFVIADIKDNLFIFVFQDDRLVGIHSSSREGESLLGNIYIGRVQNIVKNINAAFVEIAKDIVCFYSLTDNQKHIFLNRKNTDKLCIGDLILVQYAKDAVKTKVPTVSSEISIAGEYAVISFDGLDKVAVSNKIEDKDFKNKIRSFCIEKKAELKEERSSDYNFDVSIVVRTAAYEADYDRVCEKISKLMKYAQEICHKATCRPAFTCLYSNAGGVISDLVELKPTSEDEIVTDIPELYESICSKNLAGEASVRLYEDKLLPMYKCYSLESILEDALKPRVWLKSGAYLVIEPTEALTVIDVNTGKFDGNNKDRQQTFLNINLEATKEIARQLAIRNISGIIIIDFINMTNPSDKEKLVRYIKECISKDFVMTRFVDMTQLDLVELTRKKIKKPLREILR